MVIILEAGALAGERQVHLLEKSGRMAPCAQAAVTCGSQGFFVNWSSCSVAYVGIPVGFWDPINIPLSPKRIHCFPGVTEQPSWDVDRTCP